MSSIVGGGCALLLGEGMKKQWQSCVRKSPYRGDVSALCLISSPQRHLLLAGTGAQVLLYDLITGGLLCSRTVFDGVRVHGIYSGPACGKEKDTSTARAAFKMGTIVIHGERKIKLFKMVWHLEDKTPQLHSLGSLPRFSYWVMDVRILQEEGTTSKSTLAADTEDFHLLAVGLSNNTIWIWDLLNSAIIYHVECSERCLLYSMRLWGDSLEALHAGAGTVFNEVLVMKLGSNLSGVRKMSKDLTDLRIGDNSKEHQRREVIAQDTIIDSSPEFVAVEEVVDPLQRLIGHEGSIHRLTWSTDGLSLVSVSDDRSARVWCAKKSATGGSPWLEGIVPGPVLYGHISRLWDCYVGEKLLITASEDCTCRVWTAEGLYLTTLKGHIGRGIWRCVYDAEVNILVTAGADSSIKVQLLDKWVPRAISCETDQCIDPSVEKLELQSFSVSPPWLIGSSEGPSGFMDSKSEYVRCVALSSPSSLYVCTNQGAVYHVHLQSSEEASWTLLLDDLEGPIVCMDVLVQGLLRDGYSGGDYFSSVDVVAVGNGKGIVCVMQVRRIAEQWHCEWRHSWVAEKERQLLGVYFCKSLGLRYVFTTDPRGTWRMWHVSDRKDVFAKSIENPSSFTNCTDIAFCGIEEDAEKYTADLIAYGRGSQARVLCIDVCRDLELLVCGDKQGDLTAYSLPKHLCRWVLDDIKLARNTEIEAPTQLPVVAVFKGAHGISAIASVSIMPFNSGRQPEIISTGSDGCICRLLLDQHWTGVKPHTSQHFLCAGIEKVAALSIVECVQYCRGVSAHKRVDRRIAAGFTGSDFLLWDLTHQCEVMRVICGGWRRPHSVVVGDLPEMLYCFAFIKDKVIQVQRNWVNSTEGENSSVSGSSLANAAPKTTTQSLRGQFHGKEISSVLFLHSAIQSLAHEGSNLITWIATGSEDGTVMISRYAEDAGEQLDPAAVLGDHVGGSAVRALALVAEVDIVRSGELLETIADSAELEASLCGKSTGRTRDQELLFSAGAKEVLTCWLLDWLPEVEGDELSLDHCESVEKVSTSAFPSHRAPSSQWLSTHSPERVHPFVEKMATGDKETVSSAEIDERETPRVDKKQESYASRPDDADDDQRYLALTTFGARCTKKSSLISFIATASSNATLRLYAFHLAHRSWSELAVLENDTALVLTVEHLVAPFSSYDSGGRDGYVILTGAANGNIALWDVTNLVHEYCSSADHDVNRALVVPLRPLTGRGSQGGRRRKKSREQFRESANLKYNEGKLGGTQKELNPDPVCPAFVSGGENEILDEEYSGSNYIQATVMLEENGLSESVSVQPSKEPAVMKPPLRLNPDQELIAAHQSGINCMAVGRIQRDENSSSRKMIYVVISGGDDQALHLATFSLEVNNSNDIGSLQRGKVESSFASMPLVLRCLSRSSVPCAHNSSVKGLWTDGSWAFSTGLDQRLRCWRIYADVDSSKPSDICEGHASRHPKTSSPLVECLTCVIDVPEPASLHVKLCPGGLYQIAVAGRGLQVINFDSNSLSC